MWMTSIPKKENNSNPTQSLVTSVFRGASTQFSKFITFPLQIGFYIIVGGHDIQNQQHLDWLPQQH